MLDAIVTAGGRPEPKEALYNLTQGGYKAMLDLHGRPMIQWVLDALSGSGQVGRVVVVGLPITTDLTCSKPLVLLPDSGGMLQNIRAASQEILRTRPETEQVLAVSSDIPAVTPEMIDWMAERVQESDHDVYYNTIERSLMETRFPGSRRSYIHLKDREVCGGDLNALRVSSILDEKSIYQRLVDARKNPLQQATILGFDTLFLLMLRQLDLAGAEVQVCKRLGVRGRVLECPYPEIGMDVDKPFQFQMLRASLPRPAAV